MYMRAANILSILASLVWKPPGQAIRLQETPDIDGLKGHQYLLVFPKSMARPGVFCSWPPTFVNFCHFSRFAWFCAFLRFSRFLLILSNLSISRMLPRFPGFAQFCTIPRFPDLLMAQPSCMIQQQMEGDSSSRYSSAIPLFSVLTPPGPAISNIFLIFQLSSHLISGFPAISVSFPPGDAIS